MEKSHRKRQLACCGLLFLASLCEACSSARHQTPPAPTALACGAPIAKGSVQERSDRPLRITFFGVSTLAFDDGEKQLLIDGYFSRPGPVRTLLWPIGSNESLVRAGLADAKITDLQAVLTAHAHHDHALDTAMIASLRSEAVIVGDKAVQMLAVSRGTSAQRVCVPTPEQAYDFGPYRVTAYPTEHGDNPHPVEWLLDQKLRDPFPGAAWFGRYQDHENLSFLVEHGGRKVLVHASAGAWRYPEARADVVFLGIGRRGLQTQDELNDYWRETVTGTGATLVIPVHWDAFYKPLSEGLVPMPRKLANTQFALDTLKVLAREGVEFRTVQAYGSIELPPR